uniref:Secreted protein n=1 Tax=Anopheles triannulatus TaxID=58253 RepID=A0A2M4A073_9DIPT
MMVMMACLLPMLCMCMWGGGKVGYHGEAGSRLLCFERERVTRLKLIHKSTDYYRKLPSLLPFSLSLPPSHSLLFHPCASASAHPSSLLLAFGRILGGLFLTIATTTASFRLLLSVGRWSRIAALVTIVTVLLFLLFLTFLLALLIHVLFFFLLLLVIVVTVLVQHLAGVVQDRLRNDACAQEVADLEVAPDQELRLRVDLVVFLDARWREEVEERFRRLRFRDRSDGTALLVLLLLLDRLHRHVLARVPVDRAAGALVNLRALEAERFVAVDLAAQEVLLRQHRVLEVRVLVKVELDDVRHRVLLVDDVEVAQILQDRFVVRMDQLRQLLRVLEHHQPEVRDALPVLRHILVVVERHLAQLLVDLIIFVLLLLHLLAVLVLAGRIDPHGFLFRRRRGPGHDLLSPVDDRLVQLLVLALHLVHLLEELGLQLRVLELQVLQRVDALLGLLRQAADELLHHVAARCRVEIAGRVQEVWHLALRLARFRSGRHRFSLGVSFLTVYLYREPHG